MSKRQIFLNLIIVGAFGVLVPIYQGLNFVYDPRLIVAYSIMSAVIAAASVAETFGSGAGGSAHGKMIRVWLYSWGLALLLLVTALVTVNLRGWRDRLVLPSPASFLIACECISATASAAVVALGAMLTRRFSAGVAKTVFRSVFLAAILAVVIANRYGAAVPSVEDMTRWLFILSAVCGAAALALASRYPRTE
jgi:hypothetical protein